MERRNRYEEIRSHIPYAESDHPDRDHNADVHLFLYVSGLWIDRKFSTHFFLFFLILGILGGMKAVYSLIERTDHDDKEDRDER